MFSFLTKVSKFYFFCIILATSIAQANNHIELKLEGIEKIHAQESHGDELYFSITEYSSSEAARHYQVPDFPTHWLSDYLGSVKNIVLWKRDLNEGESVSLIISLVERDVPPWNVDDLLGSVKLKVKREKNRLLKEWSIPNQSNTKKLMDHMNAFVLTGDEGEYHLLLKLVESRSSTKKKDN